MVSKEQVAEFMAKYFPHCPICNANEGYEVSGLSKNYVQCKSCGAKWQSKDLPYCKELKEMALWESPKDKDGKALLHKKLPVSFWQSPDLSSSFPLRKSCPQCGKDMFPWKFEFTTQYFCEKCKQGTFELSAEETKRINIEFYVGRVVKQLGKKAGVFRIIVESPKEKVGEQIVIQGQRFSYDAANYNMRIGDKIAIVGKLDEKGYLLGFYLKNLATGLEGPLVSDTMWIGKVFIKNPYLIIGKTSLENNLKKYEEERKQVYAISTQPTLRKPVPEIDYRAQARSFEILIVRLFEKMGFKNVTPTGGASDKGVDIEAYDSNGERLIIQCKHQSLVNPVKPTQVRDFAHVIQREKVAKGYFITSSFFSPECFYKENCGDKMVLIDRNELEKLLNEHGLSLSTIEKA